MTTFPNPEHDHSQCSEQVVRAAHAICRRRGVRLTSQRERVLEVLARGHQPMGAYEIMDVLAGDGKRPAPITVYRALDFLIAQGLVHRIESRNAFIACMDGEAHHGTVVFLICRDCGNVGETLAADVGSAIDTVAEESGFRPDLTVIEIDGLCYHCADRAERVAEQAAQSAMQ